MEGRRRGREAHDRLNRRSAESLRRVRILHSRFRRPRFRDGGRVARSAPSFHTFRKPIDSAITVADGSLRGIPAEPAALVAIDDDNMIAIAPRRLRQKLAEQYVCL